MSAQRQKPIDFAAEGLRLALFVDRNCGIRVEEARKRMGAGEHCSHDHETNDLG